MEIEWTPTARETLTEALASAAPFGEATQTRLLGRIDHAIRQIAEHPFSARSGRSDGTREFVLRGFPYIMVYRIDPEALRIVAIRHTARRWPDEFPE